MSLVVLNLNPDPRERNGTRALVRALRRRVRPGLGVHERHYARMSAERLAALGTTGVVLGPQGVPFDAYPADRRAHLFALIRALTLPTLGVCGGHQALVLAWGGAIGPVFGGVAAGRYHEALQKEVGEREVRLCPEAAGDPLLGGLPARARYVVSHYEGATALSPELELVGVGDPCRVQMVRVRGRRQWGVQFHPERGADGGALLDRFVDLCSPDLDDQGAQRLNRYSPNPNTPRISS